MRARCLSIRRIPGLTRRARRSPRDRAFVSVANALGSAVANASRTVRVERGIKKRLIEVEAESREERTEDCNH